MKLDLHRVADERSYLIEDPFERGDPAFETKVQAFPNLTRKLIRENHRLKKRIEELEAGQ